MIISMAKHLRLKVVAEGIEEVEQLSFLMEGGCDYIQGYLFSKPISPQQISETFHDLHHHVNDVLMQLQYKENYSV
ncbi:EAL domain-containing protein [Lysinibacillus sp. MHQ-1]|nr:EAL domain-containing protein [Lysinibacillus sp. MHQ-1]